MVGPRARLDGCRGQKISCHPPELEPWIVAVPTELYGPTLCMIVVRSPLFTCYLNKETSVVKTEVICCYITKEVGLRSKRYKKHRKRNIPFAICQAVPTSCVCHVKRRSVFAKCVTVNFIMKYPTTGNVIYSQKT